MRQRFYIPVLFVVMLGLPGHTMLAQDSPPLLAEHPQLRDLLQQEMRALQQALGTISQALPAGDWQTVAATAKDMRDSFIFQQKLSEQDRKVLHQTLPQGFIHLDKGFHSRADKLRQAAVEHDAELSLFHYSRLVENCMVCHSQYATHRFPSLAGEPPAGHDH